MVNLYYILASVLLVTVCSDSTSTAMPDNHDGKQIETNNMGNHHNRVTRTMKKEDIPMKTAQLSRVTRIIASGPVSDQHRQSLPIPVLKPEGLFILFFYSPALARPKQPTNLWPPDYIMELNASTGKFKELKAVLPRDFGQTDTPETMIGSSGIPDGMSLEEYDRKETRLYEVYDILLPHFIAQKGSVVPDVALVAKEFKQLFPIISDPPSRRYYDAAGHKFFQWVDNIAVVTN